MYLQPIFASDDIKTKMKKEKDRFDSVDDRFKQTMDKFTKEPNLWEGVENDKLKYEFVKDNAKLDEI